MSEMHVMGVKYALWMLFGILALESSATVVERVEVSASNPFYTGNRAPLQPSPFVKLPLGSITPQGWLRRQLELDASGMCGNLPKVSEFVKPGCAWASPAGEGHHGWEEPVYWLRGYGDLGYALKQAESVARRTSCSRPSAGFLKSATTSTGNCSSAFS